MQKPGVTTTRNSITIRRVDYKTDSGLYQCLAKNKDGGVLSDEINVRVRGSYFECVSFVPRTRIRWAGGVSGPQ